MKVSLDPQSVDALGAASRSVILTDATLPDNPITYVNPAFAALTGYSQEEAVGQNCRFLQGPGTDPQARADIRAALAAGEGIQKEILNYRKDGTAFWSDLTIDPIRDAAGRLIGFVGIQSNADASHLAKVQRAEAESRLTSIADHVPGYIYQRVMRSDGTIEVTYCSPSLGKLLGVDGADVARDFYDLVHPDDLDSLFAAVHRSAAEMATFLEEFRLVSPNGSTHWLRSEAPPRRMENGEIVWDGIAIEISAEKRWESEIASHALRDPLTGLLNRTALRRALSMRLKANNGNRPGCGLLYFDIDAFSDLNSRFGQQEGDKILRKVAHRISKFAGSVGGVAARLAGDEFAVLAPACADATVLNALAESARDALDLCLENGGQPVIVQTSIGATLHVLPPRGDGEEEKLAGELMDQAELAVRWAKQGGRGHALYSPEEDDRFRSSVVLERSLEQAIADDELEIHYQPLVDLASGRIVSAEALVRWNHPTLGMQRPDVFIPLAEKTGLIIELGRWVMEQVMRQHKLWQQAGLAPPRISINVSGAQLIAPGFVAFAGGLLETLDANAADFEIELTEGLLVEPTRHILTSFHALRDMGFSIAIDDFGSGHASFRYLRDFPVDRIKLDHVFVRKLVLESADALIIRAVISLARGLRIEFVAEGIETDMQRDFLQREGCRIGQGFYFSMPLVAEDFGWMLKSKIRLPVRAPGRPHADPWLATG